MEIALFELVSLKQFLILFSADGLNQRLQVLKLTTISLRFEDVLNVNFVLCVPQKLKFGKKKQGP